jgi:hypothetical protein
LLARFEFRLIGRDAWNGRSLVVLDLKPAAKDLPARNYKDLFINRTAGRVWIDEAEAVVVKADLHLTERVSVIGGLVGAVWKFMYQFNRERTPEGLWFTRNVQWHLEGRQVFIRKVLDYLETRSDVRKAA